MYMYENSVALNDIKECIENQLDKGKKNFIIFPYGEIGMRLKACLNTAYGIQEKLIIDNNLYLYNEKIKSIEVLKNIDCHKYTIFLALNNLEIYKELKNSLLVYFDEENIAELKCIQRLMTKEKVNEREKIKIKCETEYKNTKTLVGKYSYGPLTEYPHYLIESIGAFCSFAAGTDVVRNHATDYITTHPMIYEAGENDTVRIAEYDNYEMEKWYFPGVKPHGVVRKCKRTKIGNDVWLGKNVTIVNGADIGNGVIAGAGTIITKDIPDYAIVVGVPAQIIGYRYEKNQIEALNRIKWWNWSDDEIRERYDDFYLPIEEFIRKYDI